MNDIWLFGYGSLIWKADFPFEERLVASVEGWQRRFWQGSHDHRGTPDAPGRVVTLVPAAGQRCKGMAYRIGKSVVEEVFEHLDFREKNGYERHETVVYFEARESVRGRIYLAAESNFAWMGPASDEEIAAHIYRSDGPSGSNRDYLIALAEALRGINAVDEHVFALEAGVLTLSA